MSVPRHVGENTSDQEIKTTGHEEVLQQTTEFQGQDNAKATSHLKMRGTTAQQAYITLVAPGPSAELDENNISDRIDVTLVDSVTSPALIDALNQRQAPTPGLIEENKPENKGEEKRKPTNKSKDAPSTNPLSATQVPPVALTLDNSSVAGNLIVIQQVSLAGSPSADFSFFTTQRPLFKVQDQDEKGKLLDLAKLDRLTVQLTQILKAHYASKGTVSGLLSDRRQPIADINLTIAEQKKEIKQRFNGDAKRIDRSVASATGSAGEVPSFDPGDAKRGAIHPKQKEKALDQEMLDYYEREHKVQTPIAVEAIFNKRFAHNINDSDISLFDHTDEDKRNHKSKPTIVETAPKRLLILGRPGIGKTTMSQYMAHRWAKAKLVSHSSINMEMKRERKSSLAIGSTETKEGKKELSGLSLLPSHTPLSSTEKTLWSDRFDFVFWIPLRHLSRYEYEKVGDMSLAEVIYQECCAMQVERASSIGSMSLTDTDQAPSKKELIQTIDYVLKHKKERYLILMDGGDEIAHLVAEPMLDTIQVVPRPIKKLLQQAFEAEYLILTSRPYQVNELTQLNPKGFDKKLENMGFTDEQIEDYISNYFGQEEKAKALAEGLLQFLKNNPRIWGAAHIPIHLTLICSAWEEISQKKTFNEQMNVTDLYCDIISHLLKHALVKREVDIREQGETWLYDQCEREMRLLERLAFEGLKNGSVILDKTLQRQVLDAVQSEYKVASKKPLFVEALEIGLLKGASLEEKEELDKEHYFIHLIFQEFLAAKYLVSCLNSPNTERVEEARKFISDHKYASRYQVLLGFVSGLVSRDKSSVISLTHFWNVILEQPMDLTGIGHFCLVLRCLEEGSCERNPYEKSLLKSFEVFIKNVIYNEDNFGVIKYLTPLLKHSPLVCQQIQIVPLCIKALEDKNEYVVASAILILQSVSGQVATKFDVIKALHKFLKYNNLIFYMNLMVCETLWYLIKNNLENDENKKIVVKDIIDILLKSLLTEKIALKELAIRAVGRLSELVATDEVVQLLAKAINNLNGKSNDFIVLAVIDTFECIGEKAITEPVIKILLKILSDFNTQDVKIAAFSTFKSFIEKAPETVRDILLQILNDSDWSTNPKEVKAIAVKMLGIIGIKAITKIVIQTLLSISHDDIGFYFVFDRNIAISSLVDAVFRNFTEIAIKPFSQILFDFLKHENLQIRYAAAAKSRSTTITPFIQQLFEALESKDEMDFKIPVIIALGQAQEEMIQPTVLKLCGLLKDSNVRLKRTAICTLGKLGKVASIELVNDEIIPALLKCLNDKDKSIKQVIISAFELLKEKAASLIIIEELIKLLENDNTNIKQTVIRTLGRFGRKAATCKVIEILLSFLGDYDEHVRAAAASSLGTLSPLIENSLIDKVASALLQATEDRKLNVRRNAIDALGYFNKDAVKKRVMPMLLKNINDENQDIKDAVISMLSKFCNEIPEFFIGQLCRDLGKGNNPIRSRAFIELLLKLNNKTIIKLLLQRMFKAAEDDLNIRDAVNSALLSCTEQTKKLFTEVLLQMLPDDLENTNCGVAISLLRTLSYNQKVEIQFIVPILLRTLSSKDFSIKFDAITLLISLSEQMDPESAIQTLLDALKNGDYLTNISLTLKLKKIWKNNKNIATIPIIRTLLKLLKDDKDITHNTKDTLIYFSQFVPHEVLAESLKELRRFLGNNEIVKEFLESADLPLEVLVNAYYLNSHEFLPKLIARCALSQGIPITMTEIDINLYEGAKPQSIPITSEKRKKLIKGFATVLKKQGLLDAIPQAYLSGKPVFPIAPVPKISPTMARTLHELKEIKGNSTRTIVQAASQASIHQQRQVVSNSSQAIAATDERKAEVTVSMDERVTFTLEQVSALMRRQTMVSGPAAFVQNSDKPLLQELQYATLPARLEAGEINKGGKRMLHGDTREAQSGETKGSLIEVKGESKDKDLVRSSPFLVACAEGALDRVVTFLRAGTNVLATNNEGYNALHVAAEYGYVDIVNYLADNGFDIGQENEKNKQQALHVAILHNKPHVVAALIKRGAAPNTKALVPYRNHEKELTALQIAVLNGFQPIVEILLQKSSFSDWQVQTVGNLLHLAILASRNALLNFLLTEETSTAFVGQLLEQANDDHCTPLGLAAEMGNLEAIDSLIRKKPTQNSKNHREETPLFFAVRACQSDAVELLIAHGAKIKESNKSGEDSIQLAHRLAEETKKTNETLSVQYALMEGKLKNILRDKKANRYEPPVFRKTKVKNLVFQGGGPKGIAYVGALHALEEQFREHKRSWEEIERVAGTSAGAITALLVALNINSREVKNILTATKLTDFLEGLDIERLREAKVSNLLWEWCKAAYRRKGGVSLLDILTPLKQMYNLDGLCSGDVFRKWVEARIEDALSKLDITRNDFTFGELRQLILQGKPLKHLHVVAIELTDDPKIVVFNSEDKQWDNVLVADAIRASMSIPGLFRPCKVRMKVQVGGRTEIKETSVAYVDGGISKNYPLELFDKVGYQEAVLRKYKDYPIFNRQTMGFNLINKEDEREIAEPVPLNTIKDLGKAITTVYMHTEKMAAELRGSDALRTVYIDNCGVSLLEFDLDEEKQDQLIRSGKVAVEESAFFRDSNAVLSVARESKETKGISAALMASVAAQTGSPISRQYPEGAGDSKGERKEDKSLTSAVGSVKKKMT